MANHARPIVLEPAQRRALERLRRSTSAPAVLSRRAQVILLLAAHVSNVEVARGTRYTPVQISRLRRRFAEEGVEGLRDRSRCGRPWPRWSIDIPGLFRHLPRRNIPKHLCPSSVCSAAANAGRAAPPAGQ